MAASAGAGVGTEAEVVGLDGGGRAGEVGLSAEVEVAAEGSFVAGAEGGFPTSRGRTSARGTTPGRAVASRR